MSLEKYLNTGAIIALFVGLTTYGNILNAKGLDELTPGSEVEKTKSAEEQKPKEAAPGQSTEAPKPVPQTQKELEGKEPIPAVPSGETQKPPEEKAEQPKPIERSTTSLAMENKLHLTTGLGLGKLKGKYGDWGNRGSVTLGLAYLIADKSAGKLPLFFVFNYRSGDSVVEYQEQTYRGITEGFFVGVKKFHQWKEGLFFTGGVEVGYVKNSVTSIDYLKEDSKLDRGDAMAVASASLEWKLQEKILLGPEILYGFGSNYKMFKLGVCTSFVF